MPSSADVDWRRGASWSATFDEACACQRLDDELEKLVWNLRRHAPSLEKTLRARVLRWCAKFEAEKDSPALVWKRSRNRHARALLAGLRVGRLPAPFDAGPPVEPLGAGISAACAVAVGLESRGEWAARSQDCHQQQQQQQRTTTKKKSPPLVPGMTSLRLAPPLLLADAAEAEAPAAAARESSSSAAAAAFARSHLPSGVELAASLGAATERIAELEWRLGERERRARAREWGASVAAARASAALLSSSFGDAESEEEVTREERRARKPPIVAAASSPPAGPRTEALPLPPSPAKAAAETSRRLRRPKVRVAAAAAPAPRTKAPPAKQSPMPSVSLEELSRRISALAPQQ